MAKPLARRIDRTSKDVHLTIKKPLEDTLEVPKRQRERLPGISRRMSAICSTPETVPVPVEGPGPSRLQEILPIRKRASMSSIPSIQGQSSSLRRSRSRGTLQKDASPIYDLRLDEPSSPPVVKPTNAFFSASLPSILIENFQEPSSAETDLTTLPSVSATSINSEEVIRSYDGESRPGCRQSEQSRRILMELPHLQV